MQTEDKFLAVGVVLTAAVGALLLLAMRNTGVAPSADAFTPRLPANVTRAQAIGNNYADEESSRRPFVIVEFGDYDCPPCRSVQAPLQKFLQAHAATCGLVFRHLPLEMHPGAFKAATFAEAAREQGQFWPMHDLLYQNGGRLAPKDVKRYARTLHLNWPALRSAAVTTGKARVRADMQTASALDVHATPPLLLCEPGGSVRSIAFQELEAAVE